MTVEAQPAPSPRRVMMLGATGTIGRATVRALRARHAVVCLVRPRQDGRTPDLPPEAILRFGDVTDPVSLRRDGFAGERFDALVSCLASRTGAPRDAWAIDHRAHVEALAAAREAGVRQMVLLSAICVQKPLLAFQHAKLAFEQALIASGMTWSIVRPTAYFKSLSGQIERLKRGKPFLLFGDGERTACKPISDGDLGRYLADCLDDPPCRTGSCRSAGRPRDHATPAGRAAVRAAWPGAEVQERAGGDARCDHRRAFTRWSLCAGARRQGGACTDRALLRDGIDAGARPNDRPLRCRRYALDRIETLFDFYARVIRGEESVDRGHHAVF